MAKENTSQPMNAEQSPNPPQEAPKEQTPFSLRKLVLFGVPLFFVQLVAVYFVMVKFIAPSQAVQETALAVKGEHAETSSLEPEQQVFLLKEVLVNPAGTNGTRFLLTSIGFEVSSSEAKQELEKKEVQVRDLMNTVLTSKSLAELVDYQKREEIRTEIMQRVGELVKSGTLKKVYFSKFIIQ